MPLIHYGPEHRSRLPTGPARLDEKRFGRIIREMDKGQPILKQRVRVGARHSAPLGESSLVWSARAEARGSLPAPDRNEDELHG